MREVVTLCTGQYPPLAGVYGVSILMVPTQEVAVHDWLTSISALLTVIPTVTVFVTSTTFGDSPQDVMWALVVPVYTAPMPVKVTVKGWLRAAPETTTAHGPVVQFGVNCHVSVSVVPTVRVPPGVVTTLLSTVYDPSKRAAEMGGVGVVTARTEDVSERTPPETATTLYPYCVIGTSPLSW